MEEKKKHFNVVGLPAPFPKGLFRNVYVYADSTNKQSLRTFRRKGIRSFRPQAAYHLKFSSKYCLIYCVLNKRDEPVFLEALTELERDLLIMGYRDYEQYCEEVFAFLHSKLLLAKDY